MLLFSAKDQFARKPIKKLPELTKTTIVVLLLDKAVAQFCWLVEEYAKRKGLLEVVQDEPNKTKADAIRAELAKKQVSRLNR